MVFYNIKFKRIKNIAYTSINNLLRMQFMLKSNLTFSVISKKPRNFLEENAKP